MEIDFEQQNWQQVPAHDVTTGAARHPDWHVLRARLYAADEARKAISRGDDQLRFSASGSFDSEAAQMLRSIRNQLGIVNRKDSANRNGVGGIDKAVAAASKTGDRG